MKVIEKLNHPDFTYIKIRKPSIWSVNLSGYKYIYGRVSSSGDFRKVLKIQYEVNKALHGVKELK